MYVGLNPRQLHALDAITARHDMLDAEFNLDRQWINKQCFICAPYTAWVQARDLIAEQVFTPRGGRARSGTRFAISTLRAIAAATNSMDRHPAMRNMGMTGHQPHVIHAWELPEPLLTGHVYSPAPCTVVDGYYAGRTRFVVLKPVFHTANQMCLTTWSVDGISPGADRLADECVHLAFWPG